MTTIKCSVTKSSWYSMYIEYSLSQDIENNKTTIKHALKLKQLTDNYDFNGAMSVSYTVAGTKYSFNGNVDIDDKGNSGYTITIKSGTTVVLHNDDGSKSITFSCSGSCNSGGYGPGTIKLSSTTVTLPTIARASVISDADDVTLGENCCVSWLPLSSSHSYKLSFSIGSWSYVTGVITPNMTSLYTYDDYVMPTDIALQLPNAITGTITATLYTFSDNNCTTQIGSASAKSFSVSVSETTIPSVESFEIEMDNSSNETIDLWGVYIAGFSKTRLTATASGALGSTINSFTLSDGATSNVQFGNSFNLTSNIESGGTTTFTITAQDSRGRISSPISKSIDAYSYSKPVITNFSVSRSASEQTKIIVKANWSYSSIDGKNSSTATLYYKRADATNWTTYSKNIIQNTDVILSVDFDESISYNFKLVVTDLLSSSDPKDGFISTIKVLMDFRAGGKGLGIGKIAESDNLEIALDTIFLGNIYMRDENGLDISLTNYIKKLINSIQSENG